MLLRRTELNARSPWRRLRSGVFMSIEAQGEQAVSQAIEHYQAGRKQQALELALIGAPGDPGGWNVAAGVCLDLGRYQEALQYADRALASELLPDLKAASWNARGTALVQLGRLAEARHCFGPALARPLQAMNLAITLAWAGASDAPPAGEVLELEPTGIRAWFPGPPARREGELTQFSLATPEFHYLLVCHRLTPEEAASMRSRDPEQGMLAYLEANAPGPSWRLLKLDLQLAGAVPSLGFGTVNEENGRLQVGRHWYDFPHARVVEAMVTLLRLELGAAPEPGHFLSQVDLSADSRAESG